MTSKQMLLALLTVFPADAKLDKRKVYDYATATYGVTSKQLGGMVSVLSRSGLAKVEKTTIQLTKPTE